MHKKYNKLSEKDIELLKILLIKGAYPDDIAKYFNISISTVHKYKSDFIKNENLNFPSISGRKPNHAPKIEDLIKEISKEKEGEKSEEIGSEQISYKFVINGITVEITGVPNKIDISKEGIDIKF